MGSSYVLRLWRWNDEKFANVSGEVTRMSIRSTYTISAKYLKMPLFKHDFSTIWNLGGKCAAASTGIANAIITAPLLHLCHCGAGF